MNASKAALNVKLKLRLLDRDELDRIVSKSLFKIIFFLSMPGMDVSTMTLRDIINTTMDDL